MKVVLPSNGILGCKFVNLRQPTFGDLRAMNDVNPVEGMVKFEFVKRLADSSTNFSKITRDDLEYLFQLSVFATQFNTLNFTVSCASCGETLSDVYSIEGKELVMLDRKGYPVKKTIHGTAYEWHILSAQQDVDAISYALTQEDYKSSYENAVVAFTFGKSLEDVEWAASLEPFVYFSAFLFHQSMFHGIHLIQDVTCPKCGKVTKTHLTMNSSLAFLDVDTLMSRYASVSDKLSFEAFLNISIPEFASLVDNLNKRLNS